MGPQNGYWTLETGFWTLQSTFCKYIFGSSSPSIRKVDDGEETSTKFVHNCVIYANSNIIQNLSKYAYTSSYILYINLKIQKQIGRFTFIDILREKNCTTGLYVAACVPVLCLHIYVCRAMQSQHE